MGRVRRISRGGRLFLGVISDEGSRQVARNHVQQLFQLIQILGVDARKYHCFMGLPKFAQLIQDRLRRRRQIDAVRAAIVRMFGPFEIPFGAEAIDQPARGDLPDFERLRDHALRCTGIARDYRDQRPLRPRHAAPLDALIEALSEMAGNHRQLQCYGSLLTSWLCYDPPRF